MRAQQVRVKQPIINLTPSQQGSNAPWRRALPLKQNHDNLVQELEELCLTCMCVHMNTHEPVRGLHRQAGKHERTHF